MKASEIFTKFFAELSAVEEEVKLAQAKLDNGTVLEAEAFEAGQPIFIVSEEDRIAVPVGEYLMEDGRVLVVTEEGVVGEIKSAEEETAEVEVEVEAAMEPSVEDKIREVVMPLIEEMKAELSAMKEEMGAYKKKQEMSSDVPAASAIKHNPENSVKEVVSLSQNSPESALDRVLARLNK
jgi:hypothetical protein